MRIAHLLQKSGLPHKLEQAMSFSLDPFNEGASQNGVFFIPATIFVEI
jgi:hypothetical protein